MQRSSLIHKLVSPIKRGRLANISDGIIGSLIATVLLTVIGGAWVAIGNGWGLVPPALTFAWGFITQPVQPPLVVLLILGIPLIVTIIQTSKEHLDKQNSPNPKAPDKNAGKVTIGGLVDFEGVVTYRVGGHLLSEHLHTTGPLCSKCLSEARSKSSSSSWFSYQCKGAVCGVDIHMPSLDEHLQEQAIATIKGRSRQVRLEGKIPILDSSIRFTPTPLRVIRG